MAGTNSRDLTRAEQSYLAQVTYQLRHVPSQRRGPMVHTVQRALASNAPCDTFARLEREFGAPGEYAARLQGLGRRADDGDAVVVATGRSSRSQVWWWALIAFVIFCIVAIAIAIALR